MTTSDTATPTTAAARAREPRAGQVLSLLRGAAAPVIAGLVLLGLLCFWVAGGGFGTLARERLQVTGAIVPVPAAAGQTAVYLTIANTGAQADELLSVTTNAAAGAMLTGNAVGAGKSAGSMTELSGITVPAHGTVVLGPFADDIMLMRPQHLAVGASIELTLHFRVLGEVAVTARVVPPGTA